MALKTGEAIAGLGAAPSSSTSGVFSRDGTAAIASSASAGGALASLGGADASIPLSPTAAGALAALAGAGASIPLSPSATGERKGPRMRPSGAANIAYVEGAAGPRYPRTRF